MLKFITRVVSFRKYKNLKNENIMEYFCACLYFVISSTTGERCVYNLIPTFLNELFSC